MVSTDERFRDNGDQNTIYVDGKNIVDACSVGDFIDIDDTAVVLKVTGKYSTCLENRWEVSYHHAVSECHLNHGRFNSWHFFWRAFFVMFFFPFFLYIPFRGSKFWQKWLKKRSHYLWKETSSPEKEYWWPKVWSRARNWHSFCFTCSRQKRCGRNSKSYGRGRSHIPVISKVMTKLVHERMMVLIHLGVYCRLRTKKGLENFKEILDASDGIMVARGDLGIQLSLEKVFIRSEEDNRLLQQSWKTCHCSNSNA